MGHAKPKHANTSCVFAAAGDAEWALISRGAAGDPASWSREAARLHDQVHGRPLQHLASARLSDASASCRDQGCEGHNHETHRQQPAPTHVVALYIGEGRIPGGGGGAAPGFTYVSHSSLAVVRERHCCRSKSRRSATRWPRVYSKRCRVPSEAPCLRLKVLSPVVSVLSRSGVYLHLANRVYFRKRRARSPM
jgi:hypothetical protein